MLRWITCVLLFAVPLFGAGLRFRDGASVYRLTSSARATQSQGLVRTDWAHGMALYREEVSGADVPDLASLVPGVDGPVVLNGVTGGRILSAASRRHAIAGLATVLELKGITVGPDSVGAPVFSKDGHFIGIVSHQFLQTLPGAPTRVVDWDEEPTHRESHLIVIPAAAVRSWIHDAPTIYFRQLSAARITADGLVFEAVCPPPAGDGGPQSPIGGSDGVCIGGDNPKAPPCTIAISAGDDSGNGTPPTMELAFARLHAAVGQRALFFLSSDRERVSFSHLGEFVRDLALPNLQLVISTSRDTEWHRLGLQIAELTRRTFENRHDSIAELDGLLRKLYLVGQVLASDQPSLMPRQELVDLADQKHAYEWAWINFQNSDRPAADQVEADLLRAAAI